jgi:hypothetical protein
VSDSISGVPSRVYIAVILIDDTVASKITHRSSGGCTPDEVREAYRLRADADLKQRHDGTTAGFSTTFAGRRLFAAFVPVDPSDGVWRLKTAYPV